MKKARGGAGQGQPRNSMPTPDLEKIPPELKARPQWVCWRADKTPVNPKTGGNAKADDPSTWGTFDLAVQYWQAFKDKGIAGIGYEFSADDPFTGIDLDKCRDPETGEIEPWAWEIITRLNSYTEVSPSGQGVHILLKGRLPPGPRRKGQVEMYDRGRYFTMTGLPLEGTPATIEDRQEELMALHTKTFGQAPPKSPDPPTKGPGPEPTIDLADQELIDKAHRAANGEKFGKLWRGNWQGDYPSQSEATAALLNSLMFFCGPDPARVDRLFRQSGLMRPKWDRKQSGSTWGALEIQKAINRTSEFYTPGQRSPDSTMPKERPPEGKSEPPKNEPQAPPTLKTITAKDLAAKTFSPPRWAIPDLLPEGVIILAGKPKTGKSWLALNVAVAVATGGKALGKIQVEQGEVLYLAMEDSERRLQARLEKIVFDSPPENLHFLTARDFPPLRKGGLEALDTWLTNKPEARLVIIDTLGRVKPPRGRKTDSYEHDTAIIAVLQTIAHNHNLALIVVHHTKKVETDDFVENVSGTFALTGAADCIAVLMRKDRKAADAVLKITGRDVPDTEKALKFHSDMGSWEILGEAQEYAVTQERQEILSVLRERGPKTPAQLANIIEKSRGSVKMILSRMKDSGLVKVNSEGLYESLFQ
jgi:putative DNA primase/helicase